MALGESIIVTGSRAPAAIMAEQEALGDLKLYRIPEPVTVAANSQRQVALLERSDVPIVIVYRQDVGSEGREGATPVVTARNSERGGLGLPLPSGEVALFQIHKGRRVLVRSEEHTSELQSLMRISYAVFCLKKKKTTVSRYHN